MFLATAVSFPVVDTGLERFVYATIVSDAIDRTAFKDEEEISVGIVVENAAQVEEWIKRSREGDTQAMGFIYEKFKTPVFNLAFRYTYDSAASEDLLQDVFVKIFTSLDSLEKNEAFVGWLYRVAVNTCLSHLRSRGRFLKKAIPLDDVEGVLSEKKGESPEEVLKKPIEEAIRGLSTKLKSVFLLHDVQGFKHEEIAGILGCSVGTSKSQLFKARMKIRKHLEGKKIFKGDRG